MTNQNTQQTNDQNKEKAVVQNNTEKAVVQNNTEKAVIDQQNVTKR